MSETDMRARLRARIAEQDAARGRPLTDVERLDNLAAALAAIPPCPSCGGKGCQDCDWFGTEP